MFILWYNALYTTFATAIPNTSLNKNYKNINKICITAKKIVPLQVKLGNELLCQKPNPP